MQPDGVIYVVTGDRDSGKSTVCAKVAREAVRRGLTVAGILTERSAAGQGAARRVVDLRSGESRPFGSQAPVGGRHVGAEAHPAGVTLRSDVLHGSATDPLTPGWEFDSEVFRWANEVFSRSTPCDLLIVDELGPLELLGSRGWEEALAALRSRDFGVALVVCRPGLLGELETCLGGPPSGVLQVDPQTRDALPATIVEEVLRSGAGA